MKREEVDRGRVDRLLGTWGTAIDSSAPDPDQIPLPPQQSLSFFAPTRRQYCALLTPGVWLEGKVVWVFEGLESNVSLGCEWGF